MELEHVEQRVDNMELVHQPVPPAPAQADPEQRLTQLLDAVPAERLRLLAALTRCFTPQPHPALEGALKEMGSHSLTVYGPLTLLDWLVEAGGLVRSREAGRDDLWTTTHAGRAVAQKNDLGTATRSLIEGEPIYREVYLRLLEYCRTARSTPDVEAAIESDPALAEPRRYAAFFTGGLEDTGALRFTDGWMTTDVGLQVLYAYGRSNPV